MISPTARRRSRKTSGIVKSHDFSDGDSISGRLPNVQSPCSAPRPDFSSTAARWVVRNHLLALAEIRTYGFNAAPHTCMQVFALSLGLLGVDEFSGGARVEPPP